MLTYTTLFGWVSAFLYVRTGFVVAAILCHAFCNFMGVPQFGDALTGRHRTRTWPRACVRACVACVRRRA